MATNFGFMPVTEGPRYFISYKSDDTGRVGEIARFLNQKGVPLWYDYGIEKGEKWSSEITRSIEASKAILLFVTKAMFAAEDTYVRKEFRIARGYGRKVNVVWLDDGAFGDVHTGIKDWFVDVEDLQGIRAVGLTAEQTAQRMIEELALSSGGRPQPPSPGFDLTIEEQLQRASVGDTVRFGQYPQGSAGEFLPIAWRVLEFRGGAALLLSEKLLDCKPYNNALDQVTWDDCSLRDWLDTAFVRMAFDYAQQKKLLTVTNENPDNPECDTKGGKPTKDRVFLLSIDEVSRYFLYDEHRKASVTPYAHRCGAWVDEKSGCSFWWLRSPGFSEFDAAYVDQNGEVDMDGLDVTDETEICEVCVRPALWIKMSS